MQVTETARAKARARAFWISIFAYVTATVLVVFASVGAIVGIIILVSSGTFFDGRAGLVLLVFFGAFPFALAVFALWRGILASRRATRLEALGGLARLQPGFGVRDIAVALTLDAAETERFVSAVRRTGILHDDAPPRALAAAEADPLLGTTLNRTYRIERRIGQGGMGAVYVGEHLRLGKRFAVKTIHADHRTSKDAIRRFEREANAASSLGHPGIVAVHDFDETAEGVHFLVMELLEGETLETRLQRSGQVTWSEAREIALALASALGAAHTAGLLHRDIKPANILLNADPMRPSKAVLLDFGLAKPLDAAASRITSTGAILGTPLYMSPEQARGEGLDVRSDVYSLAAVTYEMVTGAPPFFDTSVANVYQKLLTQPAPRVSSVTNGMLPLGLDQVLERALQKDPNARFSDMSTFAAALAAVA